MADTLTPPAGGPDFDGWLRDGEGALQRTAHLLTGSVQAAQDLVQTTLAQLYRRWDRIRDADEVDAVALRVLVTELRTAWRRPGRRGDLLVEVVPDRPLPGSPSYDESLEAVWGFVCSLPTKQRIVVVLRYHERLTEAEVADLTRSSVSTVTSHGSRALASLRALPEHPEIAEDESATGPTSAESVLTRTLEEVVETTDYPTTTTAAVVARLRALDRARRRTAALVAAAAAVVVVGGAAMVRLDHARTPSPTADQFPAGSLSGLPQGEAPHVAFLDGTTFVTAGGERISAHVFGTATTATPLGGGVLVAGRTTTQRPFAPISLVEGGSTRRLGCGTPSFALGSGDPAYWLSRGCRFVGPGRLFRGTTITRTPRGVIYFPVGSTSRGMVTDADVALVQGAGQGGPVLIGPDGSRSRIPHVTSVAAVSPSGARVVGLNSLGNVVVSDLSTGAVRWRALGTPGHFSASGRYVVTMQNLGAQTVQGVGDVVAIRVATTGRQVMSTVLPDLSVVGPPVWEGDGAVLVVAEDRHRQQAIVRVGLDGTITRASRVAAGTDTFRLAASP